MATGRYFVGVQVPPATCGEQLLQAEQRLEPHLAVKKWYRPEQFHLTLHFIGNLDERDVERVKELLQPIAREHAAFSLRLDRIGWFPNAKVVWCGVEGEMDKLRSMQRPVAQVLQANGFGRIDHAEYKPHITLGRLREVNRAFRPEQVDVSDLLRGANGDPLAWQVDAFHLYESVSTPHGGPQYPIRHSWKLH